MPEINFFTPYEAQKPILKACLNPNIRYVVYNASRQSGKTLMLSNIAVYYALSEKDQHVMVISPKESQVKKIYKQIVAAVHHLPLVKSFKIQAGDCEIRFHNGSVILFRSAAAYNSLRGYTNTHLLLDEASYIEESMYQEVLIGTMTAQGKKFCFFSTPFGNNWFRSLYNFGQSEEHPAYLSFKTTYLDNPHANLEIIEDAKLTTAPDIFNQEYMGEFIDASGIFQNIDFLATKNREAIPEPGEHYFIGIDLAFKVDYTVIIILNSKGEMVYMDRFNRVTPDGLVLRIQNIIEEWKPVKTYIESNNQGLLIVDSVQKICFGVEGFDTTGKSKPQVINNLMYAFGKKEIKILNEEKVKDEFKAFGYEISKSNNIKFRANYGHDDIVMATAMAWECMRNNRYSGELIFR